MYVRAESEPLNNVLVRDMGRGPGIISNEYVHTRTHILIMLSASAPQLYSRGGNFAPLVLK